MKALQICAFQWRKITSSEAETVEYCSNLHWLASATAHMYWVGKSKVVQASCFSTPLERFAFIPQPLLASCLLRLEPRPCKRLRVILLSAFYQTSVPPLIITRICSFVSFTNSQYPQITPFPTSPLNLQNVSTHVLKLPLCSSQHWGCPHHGALESVPPAAPDAARAGGA